MILTLTLIGMGVGAWKSLQSKKISSHKSILKVEKEASLDTKLSKDLEEVTTYQDISLVALTLTGLGAVVYAPLTLFAMPFLGYNLFQVAKQTYITIVKKNQIMLGVFEFISMFGGFITGYYFISSFAFFMYFSILKLILKTERSAHVDFSNIFSSLPQKVWLLKGSVELEVSLESLQKNDTIVIRAGEVIATDGIIVAGEGTFNESMLTGESQSIEKTKEDKVFASTLLLSGWVHVKVTKQGIDSTTGQIVQVLKNVAKNKTHLQSRGDKIVNEGAGVSMLSSALALPLLGLDTALALTYSGFGYQMRIASPLTMLNYIRIASSHGILIKDGRALEKLLEVNTIIFDKTGTLTTEIPLVTKVLSCSQLSKQELLQYASSAEQRQTHPIAKAILYKANEDRIINYKVENSNYTMGYGIQVIFESTNEKSILLGSERFMKLNKITIPSNIQQIEEESSKKGSSLVYIANEKSLLGIIEVSPQIRKEVFSMVKKLHQMNKKLYIISGDKNEPTQHLAEALGIPNYYAQMLPEEKANVVEELQKHGKKVCFIGDGINDTVVLQKADVSISLHGASTIAMDVADILLIKPDLSLLPYLFEMSLKFDKQINNNMKLNTISSVSSVSAVLLLGMGYGGAVLFYYTTMGANIGYSMLPILEEKMKVNKKGKKK